MPLIQWPIWNRVWKKIIWVWKDFKIIYLKMDELNNEEKRNYFKIKMQESRKRNIKRKINIKRDKKRILELLEIAMQEIGTFQWEQLHEIKKILNK